MLSRSCGDEVGFLSYYLKSHARFHKNGLQAQFATNIHKNNKDRLVVQIYVFGTLTSFSCMVETGCLLLNYILLRDETKSRNSIGNISTVYGPISPHLCSKVSQLDARFVVESKHIFGTAYTGRGTVSYTINYIRLSLVVHM